MKRVLFLGDNHGRTDWIHWAEHAVKENIDVVFLGDYYDSFDYKGHSIEANLQQIIAFKKLHDHRKTKVSSRPTVTLLLGNHDYAYMIGKNQTSGYEILHEKSRRDLLNDNWDLFDLAWGYLNKETGQYTLATHAGITNEFWRVVKEHYGDFIEKIIEDPWYFVNIHNTLNVLKDKFTLLWEIGPIRRGDGTPGILWADIIELVADPYPNINQVVGHSAYKSPEMFFNDDGTFIAKIDGFGKETSRLLLNL